ncbi:unnamed protein product [Aspergillus oryzae RIB40]|uniref:DNA, SC020 n=2 Tax=Aspergillus oryzae TaxID=5062 RepID=Q2U441_ASPOR|nr:unnamed protein product [Aspergillus oryzae RIB40]EIT76360.1 hypothetical protein Ao3042_07494 [Aspergillus oryzae 3.042]KDE85168.1 hypothetical protein AO1008_00541 [Aspergillus oryzae 100-8]BAE63674.1 unnamed protein product [Aspergillus oryzae RIB40]|eukprot:EIT76360.1 hypothetical protein Ao3042_07494 [Aspergillus oryzae 3.042]
MPRDADFLSPRDLLINDNFCLKLASFKQLANVIVKTENLPRDDDSLRQKTGFWESGYQIVQNVALNLNTPSVRRSWTFATVPPTTTTKSSRTSKPCARIPTTRPCARRSCKRSMTATPRSRLFGTKPPSGAEICIPTAWTRVIARRQCVTWLPPFRAPRYAIG